MSDTPEIDPTIGVLDPTTPGVSLPASERRPELPKGRVLGERYEIIKLLGRGGMGAVYAAHDHKLDRQVALKLLHSTRSDAPERLVAEAKALARLSDPHVVAIYDAGDLDGQVFIAMQLVDGEDLATALARRRPPPQHILSWFADAGRGLASAHAVHLVHRDFKPSNVLIDRSGHVAVTDFGLARTTTGEPRGLTGFNVMMGTPAYMSPEQHSLQPATEASDQFSYCVSVWESLFGQHPFIQGDRGSMSPFEIGYQIFDGALIPPPKKTRVPRRVIDALTRGLLRDPAKRWPSMNALVAELAPAEVRRRVWPLVVGAGLVAAAAGGAAVWFFVTRSGNACEIDGRERASSAWSADSANKVHDHFAKTGRSYADAAARLVSTSLDGYATRWSLLATDVCSAEHAQTGSTSDLAARRRACLDGRLDALRALAGLFTTEDNPQFVDHAQEMVDTLPDLGECSDANALLAAPGVPPADKASAITKLEIDLGAAIARSRGGEQEKVAGDLAALVKQADALGWPPLRARAHLALGENQTRQLMPARDELLLAGELATAHHLDREAARAWAVAAQDAGFNKQADAVTVLVPLARAAAARTGDRDLQIGAEISAGRALIRLHSFNDALATCKSALVAAQAIDRSTEIDRASDCLIEALAPLGMFKDLEPLLAERIEAKTRLYGADHPNVADLLAVRAQIEMLHGQLDLARKDVARSLEIRRRAYPPRHVKIAESLKVQGQLAAAEGKVADAKQLYEEALAIAADAKPEPLTLLAALHQALALVAKASEDKPGELEHYEDGIAVTRKLTGNDSLEVAMLMFNYGQVKAQGNIDDGLAIINEARAILERLHDPRAALASGVMASIEIAKSKWEDARVHSEAALAHPEIYTPDNIAELKWTLARAIVGSHGDTKRAMKLATESRDLYATLGPAHAADVKAVNAWLAALSH